MPDVTEENQQVDTAPVAETAAKPKKEKKVKEPKAEKPPKEPKPVKEPAVKAPKDTKNGVTRPSTGVTLSVWTTADSLSSEGPTERATLVEALKGKVEVGTIHTQYGRWRKYYGLTETKEERQARLDKSREAKKAIKAAEKSEAKVQKDAEAAVKAKEKQKLKDAKDAEKAAKAAEKKPAEPAQ